jgi:hypothetical protein
MIRKESWILLVVLAALVGVAWYLSQPNTPMKASATATPTIKPTSYLIATDSASIAAFGITSHEGASVVVKRGPGGVWIVTEPIEGIADQGYMDQIAVQLASIRILATLDSAPPTSATGLDKPGYTLTVTTADGRDFIYNVGKLTVTNNGYYVADPAGVIHVIAMTSLDTFTSLLASPPYAETPTPSPMPTETPLPTLTGTATLGPTGTSKP